MLLDEVSLAIEPNEFVGVLGPSGAGKSVLMKALNGMRHTTRGRILINNLELYQHLDSLKQSIGYVPLRRATLACHYCELPHCGVTAAAYAADSVFSARYRGPDRTIRRPHAARFRAPLRMETG